MFPVFRYRPAVDGLPHFMSGGTHLARCVLPPVSLHARPRLSKTGVWKGPTVSLDRQDLDQIGEIIRNAIGQSQERLIALIQSSFDRIDQQFHEVTTRFDTQAARMERHAVLLQTGSRQISKINDWADKVDAALDKKDQQIAELWERLRKLEKGNGGA